MFTAIVFDIESHHRIWNRALNLNLLRCGWNEKCHHVTLAMGAQDETFTVGAERVLTVTHYGEKAGRVTAFRVAGAGDSVNKMPHVTVAVAPDAKPRESNEITEWVEIEPFQVVGKVAICK